MKETPNKNLIILEEHKRKEGMEAYEEDNKPETVEGNLDSGKENKKESTQIKSKTEESDVKKVKSIEYYFEKGNPVEVKVKRPSGKIESGWFAVKNNNENVVVVKDLGNGKIIKKVVSLKKLKETNGALDFSKIKKEENIPDVLHSNTEGEEDKSVSNNERSERSIDIAENKNNILEEDFVKTKEENLEIAKNNFLAKYKDYIKTRRLRESFGLSKKDEQLPDELRDLKSKYRDSKIEYMQVCYRKRKQEIFNNMDDMSDVNNIDIKKAQEVNKIMDKEYFSAKIFDEVELSQQENVQNAKIEALKIKEKNLFMKTVQWYSKKSTISKTVFSIAIATGAFAGVALTAPVSSSVAVGATLSYAGQKTVRRLIGAMSGYLFGSIAGKVGERTVKKVEGETKKSFEKSFDVRSLGKMEKLSEERLKKIENLKIRALVAKSLVAISAGMITGRATYELLHSDFAGLVAGELLGHGHMSNATSVGTHTDAISGGVRDSVETEDTVRSSGGQSQADMLMEQTRGIGGTQADMLDSQSLDADKAHIPGQGHRNLPNLHMEDSVDKKTTFLPSEKVPESIIAHSTIDKGGNIWDSAKSLVKDPNEFSEAWKNSMVNIPGQEDAIHISDVNLVHPGTVVEYVQGTGGAPGHFEILAPQGHTLPDINAQTAFTETMHSVGGHDRAIKTFTPEVLRGVDDLMKDKIDNIYKYRFLFFGGNQIEEWNGSPTDGVVGIKDMKVEEILNGNFGEPFGGQLDAAQENNREQLLKFLKELDSEVKPLKGETTGEYIRRALAVQVSATQEGAKVLDIETLDGNGIDRADGGMINKSINIDKIDIKSNTVNGVIESKVVVTGEVKGYTGTEVLSKDYPSELKTNPLESSLVESEVKDVSRNLSLKLAAYDQLRNDGLNEKADILLKNIHEDVTLYDKRFGSGVIDHSKIPELK